jgi:hypothetical protein
MVLQLGDAAMTADAQLMGEDKWWSIVEVSAKGLQGL